MLKPYLALGAFIAAGAVSAGSASAATLTFVEMATANGSLNGQAFTGALVTFSGSADTSNIVISGPNVYNLAIALMRVTVAGVGTDTFTDQIVLVSNQSFQAIGLGDVSINQAILFAGTPPGSYDLSTSFGPVTGRPIFNPGTPFNTTAGVFGLNVASTVTYQATVGNVPEPTTWAMMLLGFGGLGALLRKRRLQDRDPAVAQPV
jgi:hypothetical protein